MIKKCNKFRIILYLFIIESIAIILNYVLYRFIDNSLKQNLNLYVKYFCCFFIASINYFLCIRYVLKKKFNIKEFILFYAISFFILFFRKFTLYFFSKHYILLNGTFLKIVIYIIFIILTIFFKLKLFGLSNLINWGKNSINCILHKINSAYIKLVTKFRGVNLLFPKNIVLFLLFIILIITSINFYKENNNIILYEQSSLNSNIGPITSKEKTINLKNVSVTDDFNILCLKFATYNRVNNSIVKVKINDEKSNEVYSKKIKAQNIVDGANYCFNIPKVNKKLVSSYSIKISAQKSENNNFVTVYKDSKKNIAAMTLLKENKNTVKKGIIIAIILLYFLINVLLNLFWEKISNKKFYLMMLIYIIPIIFVYPPFSSPDENLHFYQSYSSSQAIEIKNTKKIVLPRNISCLSYTGINYKVYDFRKVSKCINSKINKKYDLDKSPGMERDINPSSISIGYLFQALSIKLLDIFTNSPLLLYYISKFLASMCSFVLIYFSMKKISKYQNILLFFVTMPMFIQQMCSFSYDSLLNTIVIIFFTCYVNILSAKNKINYFDFIPLFLVLIYLMILKIVYLPFILLILFIPASKFKSKSVKWANILLLFFTSTFMYYVIKNLFISNSIVNSTGVKQINYVLNNPIMMVDVIKNTFTIDGWNYIKGIFGFFSWLKYAFDDVIIIANMIFIIALFRSEKSLFSNNRMRVILFIIIFISISLIFASMYFCWDYNYKLSYIAGVQGRYFLPILPFIFLLVSPFKNHYKISNYVLYMFINMMLFLHLLYSFIYFY